MYVHGVSVVEYLNAVREAGSLIHEALGNDVRIVDGKKAVFDAKGNIMSTDFDLPKDKADGSGQYCMDSRLFYAGIDGVDVNLLPDASDYNLSSIEQIPQEWIPTPQGA